MPHHGFLPTDDQVRVSFSFPEALNLDTVPEWVDVLQDAVKHDHLHKEDPIYASSGGTLPSGLLRLITARNLLGLGQVTARNKIRSDGSKWALLGFTFDTRGTSLGLFQEEALKRLNLSLALPWDQVHIYRRDRDKYSSTVNISFIKQQRVPEAAVFSGYNDWGIKKLLSKH